MSLSLNYRPPDFESFVGNDVEIEKLEAVLTRETDVPQTYLFKGPRGCGKTTLARIAAKMVGCLADDVIEMDIAAAGGKEMAVELKGSVMYMPLHGDVKAYILDEVHEGTSKFFNALLKTLEEPPKHVYFFLCTTEPQKVLKTVLSRCHPFNVVPLSKDDMFDLLVDVMEKERGTLEDTHIDMIVDAAEGIPREGLIMLDDVIDLPADKIEQAVATIKTQEKLTIDLCRSLLKKESWKSIAAIIKGLKDEPESVRRAVLGYMATVLLSAGKGSAQAATIIEEFSEPFYNTGRAGLAKAAHMSCI